MYHQLDGVTLKSGERVSAGIVLGPDRDWRARIERLLAHKSDPWDWQNSELLTQNVGIEARFHVLHREGRPFCHIMTAESNGVGLLGHVYTEPEDRGKGAASRLMGLAMDGFRARDGRAMYLSTGFDTPPYHIYRKHGFEGIEEASGIMAWFAQSGKDFETDYFAPGPVEIQPVDWRHWAAATPLMAGAFPGVVRCLPLGIVGRCTTEATLLPAIRAAREGEPGVHLLTNTATGAVVGLVAWRPDRPWQHAQIDVYCHPNFWDHADALLKALRLPTGSRIVAFSDPDCPRKQVAIEAFGMKPVATLPLWHPADHAGTAMVDITIHVRAR